MLQGTFFFFQAEDGIRDRNVTGVQTCALPICGQGTRLPRRGPGRGPGPDRRPGAAAARPGRCADRADVVVARSEERRVGKECRCRWGADDEKKKTGRDVWGERMLTRTWNNKSA